MPTEKKYDIKSEDVAYLASIGCTKTEIAGLYGCEQSLISKSYSSEYEKGQADLKKRLRKWQINAAEKGNVAMLIFLGKVYLGQRETDEPQNPYTPETIDFKFKKVE